jgi:hypothetical protein
LLSLWIDEKKEEILKYSPAWSPIIPFHISYHVTDDVYVSPDKKMNDVILGFFSSLITPNEASYCTYYIPLNSSTKSSHKVV